MYLRGWHSSYIPWLYLHNPVTVRFYRRILNSCLMGISQFSSLTINMVYLPSILPSQTTTSYRWHGHNLPRLRVGFCWLILRSDGAEGHYIWHQRNECSMCEGHRHQLFHTSVTCIKFDPPPKCWFHFSWPSITWSQKWGITNQVAAWSCQSCRP